MVEQGPTPKEPDEDPVEDLESRAGRARTRQGGVGSGKAQLFARDNKRFDQSIALGRVALADLEVAEPLRRLVGPLPCSPPSRRAGPTERTRPCLATESGSPSNTASTDPSGRFGDPACNAALLRLAARAVAEEDSLHLSGHADATADPLGIGHAVRIPAVRER